MQKRSHSLLASTLLQAHHGFSARRFEWAFLLGSVQPDCNPLSYLKGTLRARPFHGHNFTNSQRFIARRMTRLQRCRHWGLWQYYTLGKLTHYLADAFIYPHNDHYPDSLLAHRRYENGFRLYLAKMLTPAAICASQPWDNATAAMEALHAQYQSAQSNMQRDMAYILAATELLMEACAPKVAIST